MKSSACIRRVPYFLRDELLRFLIIQLRDTQIQENIPHGFFLILSYLFNLIPLSYDYNNAYNNAYIYMLYNFFNSLEKLSNVLYINLLNLRELNIMQNIVLFRIFRKIVQVERATLRHG